MFYRFSIFRRILDAEMKEGTRLGIGLANKKEEKLPVDEEDENKFWTLGLLGKNSAKSLLNVVYSYNGKLFGLRASKHRNVLFHMLVLFWVQIHIQARMTQSKIPL